MTRLGTRANESSIAVETCEHAGIDQEAADGRAAPLVAGQRCDMPGPYSRVTDPERFAPLHHFAVELLMRLEADFDVERAEGHDLDPQGEPTQLARASVLLKPSNVRAAPILVSFTTFPGLFVRAGRWHGEPMPACGCDALPRILGSAWKTWEIGGHGSRLTRGGPTRIARAEAREMLRGNRQRYDWEPWPRR